MADAKEAFLEHVMDTIRTRVRQGFNIVPIDGTSNFKVTPAPGEDHRMTCTFCGAVQHICGSPTPDEDMAQPQASLSYLEDPSLAFHASGDLLCLLSNSSKAILRTAFSDAEKVLLTPEQKAAINIDNVVVQAIGEESQGPVTYHIAPFDEDRIHISMESSKCWYAIIRGRGFTGVVRGSYRADGYTVGVSKSLALRHSTRFDAERAWLESYYMGHTGVI